MFTAEKVQSLVMMCRMLNSRAGKMAGASVCECLRLYTPLE